MIFIRYEQTTCTCKDRARYTIHKLQMRQILPQLQLLLQIRKKSRMKQRFNDFDESNKQQ